MQGLYNKFAVKRNDDTDSKPEDKHWNCDYFVLDLTHDKHAFDALMAYRDSCLEEFPELARDLSVKLEEMTYRSFD